MCMVKPKGKGFMGVRAVWDKAKHGPENKGVRTAIVFFDF